MTARGAQLVMAEVARTPVSTPPPLPAAPPPRTSSPAPRPEQLLVTTCDVCRKPLSYKGTGRYPITCRKPECQREHRRRRGAAACSSRSLSA